MAKNLSEDDLEELKSAFEQYDLNKDGSISIAEFIKCMSQIGITMSDEDAKQFVKQMDADGNGKIEWQEYLDAKVKEIEKEKNPFY